MMISIGTTLSKNDMSNSLQAKQDDFDLTYWIYLALSDPEEFEKQKSNMVNVFSAGQPEAKQRDFEQLKWRFGSKRNVSANSLASCLCIYEMLMEKIS